MPLVAFDRVAFECLEPLASLGTIGVLAKYVGEGRRIRIEVDEQGVVSDKRMRG